MNVKSALFATALLGLATDAQSVVLLQPGAVFNFGEIEYGQSKTENIFVAGRSSTSSFFPTDPNAFFGPLGTGVVEVITNIVATPTFLSINRAFTASSVDEATRTECLALQQQYSPDLGACYRITVTSNPDFANGFVVNYQTNFDRILVYADGRRANDTLGPTNAADFAAIAYTPIPPVTTPSPVPLPAALPLLGLGTAGVCAAGVVRKRRK
jgi:hypothetical protein